VPDAFEGGQIVQQARALKPDLVIVARAHSNAAVEHLSSLGATSVVLGERETAHAMVEAVAARTG
jgi:CPA2 family monovalent cation:H+ antiporter-2